MEEEIEIVLPPARTFSEGVAEGSIPPEPEKTQETVKLPEVKAKPETGNTTRRVRVQRDDTIWKKKSS